MENNLNLEKHSVLTEALSKEIENFLLDSSTVFNPLFSSPQWAKRVFEMSNFNFEYLVVRNKRDIVGLHLSFLKYRGYERVEDLPFLVKGVMLFFVKKYYSYLNWTNQVIIKNLTTDTDKYKVKSIIYQYLAKKREKILNSPIEDEDYDMYFKNFSKSKWGTYILNFSGKSYAEIYSSFKRQARKSIEKTLKNYDVVVKRLETDEEISGWCEWSNRIGKLNNKKPYPLESRIKQFSYFKKRNYIHEIFVVYHEDMIIGSMGIWGFGGFISEFGVYTDPFALKNKIYVQDIIKNEIIKFAFENKINFFDLSGFNPNNASPKEKAIKQFKEKWRGSKLIYTILN